MSEAVAADDPLNIARPRPAPLPWHTRWFLLAYYALAVVWGVRSVWYSEQMALDLLMPVLMALCLGWWTTTDARRRKRPIPPLSKLWFYVLAGVLVPGYIVWSRGWRGTGWVLLHFVCWYVLCLATMLVGGSLVFGREWWTGLAAG